MFTGIIEVKAQVHELKPFRGGRRLSVRVPARWSRLPLGSSVAVDGCCLTVCARRSGRLFFDLLKETLVRTHFSSLRRGDAVNLERPLKAKQRIEGHFVQGHVDGLGLVKRTEQANREKSLFISFPKHLQPFFVPKGSVAVNGVSLTVGRVRGGRFSVHVIPHTMKKTNLGTLKAGSYVNLEADVLLKFFHQLTRSEANYKLRASHSAVRKHHEKT